MLASANYTYEKAVGKLGEYGVYQYNRIIERYDLDGDRKYNRESYSYSYQNFTGYPLDFKTKYVSTGHTAWDSVPDYFYTTTVTSETKNTKTEHTFNKKNLKVSSKLYSGKTLKQETLHEYDSKKQPTEVTEKVRQLCNPDMIIYDPLYKEFYFIKGNDLLRMSSDMKFISIYPSANSTRVIRALDNGGIVMYTKSSNAIINTSSPNYGGSFVGGGSTRGAAGRR